MGKRIKVVGIALALVAIVATGVGASSALAAEPTPTPTTPAYCGLGGGFRFGGAIIDQVVTKLLGMTQEQIHALRAEGKSLVQIAATKNVSEKQLVDAIMAYKKTQVQARVTAGTLTQAQADLILKQVQDSTTQAVNRTALGQKAGGTGIRQGGAGAGAGRMNRWAR